MILIINKVDNDDDNDNGIDHEQCDVQYNEHV